MGFHEDDRIRRKNANVIDGIMLDKVNLSLHDVTVGEIVELLVGRGFCIKLEPNRTITVKRNTRRGQEVKSDC